MEDHEEEKDLFDKVINAWWGKMLFALGMFAFCWFLFSQFTLLESGEKDGMMVWAPIALLYNIGGKWGGVSLFALFGVGFGAWGIKQLLSGKE